MLPILYFFVASLIFVCYNTQNENYEVIKTLLKTDKTADYAFIFDSAQKGLLL